MESDVRLEGVTKRFGKVTAVDGLGLEVSRGEFVSVIGPSGCGKTTMMRLIAGLDQPEATRGAGAGTGRGTLPHPPRRAARFVGRQASDRDAERTQVFATSDGDHVHPRVPQPG